MKISKGDIDELVIPSKMDIRGKRYGSVRFYNVSDEDLLAMELANIFISRRQIFANLSRLQRKQAQSVVEDEMKKGWGKQVAFHHETSRVYNDYARMNRGNSYAVALKSKGGSSLTNTRCKVKFYLKEKDLFRVLKAYVGFIKNSEMSYNMQNFFNMEGYFFIQVTPLGANLCLIEDRVEGEMQVLMEGTG